MLSSFHIHLESLRLRKKSLLLLNSPRLFLTSSFLLKYSLSLLRLSYIVLCSVRYILPHSLACIRTTYCLITSQASSVLYLLALVLKIETLTETIIHARRKKFVVGARGGHVACATKCEIGLALLKTRSRRARTRVRSLCAKRERKACSALTRC